MPFEGEKFEVPPEKKTEEELAMEAEEKRGREYEEWKEHFGPLAEAQIAQEKEVELVDIDKEAGVPKQEIKEEEARVEELVGVAAEKGGIDDPVAEKAEGCLEAVAKPEIGVIEKAQEQREKKISGLAEVKEVGMGRLRKVEEGLAYLAAPDRLALAGLKEAEKFAVKSGKTLGWLGLSPLAGIENRFNKVRGTVEFGMGAIRKYMAEAEIQTIEGMSEEEQTDAYHRSLESARETSLRTSQEMARAMERRRKKGWLSRFIEKYFK